MDKEEKGSYPAISLENGLSTFCWLTPVFSHGLGGEPIFTEVFSKVKSRRLRKRESSARVEMAL